MSKMDNLKLMFNWIARNQAFVLITYCVTAVLTLALTKGTDVTTVLPTLVGLYFGHQASRAVSSHIAASRDPECNTKDVISEVEGIRPPKG